MKRSEMVKILSDFIEVEFEVHSDNIDTKANDLLATIIRTGMVPPRIPTYTSSGEFWNNAHEWEKE